MEWFFPLEKTLSNNFYWERKTSNFFSRKFLFIKDCSSSKAIKKEFSISFSVIKSSSRASRKFVFFHFLINSYDRFVVSDPFPWRERKKNFLKFIFGRNFQHFFLVHLFWKENILKKISLKKKINEIFLRIYFGWNYRKYCIYYRVYILIIKRHWASNIQ